MRYLLLFLAIFSFVDPVFSQSKVSLEGTWELKSFVSHRSGDAVWNKNPSDILYQKHISGDHFTWVKFDMTKNVLVGMGGGTYYIDEQGRYVENLKFFYPAGSSELGQTIPFDVKIKGKEWYHTGFAKNFDIGAMGETVVVDSTKIEEIWKPVKAKKASGDLVGAWELSKYMENPETGYMEYPDMIGYMKILTPTHFVWVKYDKEGDQIYAAASGPYKVEDSIYIEIIKMHYPDSQLVGTTIEFEKEISGNQWKHVGTLPRPNGEKDLIDEFWKPLIEVVGASGDF